MSKSTQEENGNFFDSLSEHDKKLMKMAAAKVTGIDTSDLEVQQALELFQNHHIDMDMDPIIDAVSHNVIENFKSILAPDEMEFFTKCLLADDFKAVLTEKAESMGKALQFERAFMAMSAEEKKITEPAAENFSKAIQVKMGNSVINRFIEDTLTDTCIEALNSVFNFLQSDEWKEKIEEINLNSKRKEAKKEDVITTINGKLLFISDKKMQDILKTSTRKEGLFRIVDGEKKELATDFGTTFYSGIATAFRIAYKEGQDIEEGIEIYFPTIAKEMGIDLRDSKKRVQRADARNEYVERKFLSDIDNIYGTFPNETTEYKIMAVHSYDPVTEIIRIQSPHLAHAIKLLEKKEEDNKRYKKTFNTGICDFLLKSTAVSCRNQPAIEMLTRVLTGLIQRGTRTPDPGNTIFTWNIKCKNLIEDCPKIREGLKAKKTAREKTYMMQRAFKSMYAGFKTYTHAYDYFENFTITEIIPTATALDGMITITYTGKNPNFKK